MEPEGILMKKGSGEHDAKGPQQDSNDNQKTLPQFEEWNRSHMKTG
jgi:hypothetical protein